MHEPHTLSDQSPYVQSMAKLAASTNDPQLLQTVGQLEAVVRCPAEDKQRHQGDDEAERLALLAAAGVAERSEDADVAVEHDEQGEHEAQDHTDQLQSHLPLCGVVSEPHLAQQRLLMACHFPRHNLFEGNVHSAQGQAARPDDGTGDLGMAGVALPAGFDGVNDGQVSVKANAGQQEDAAVEVQGEEGARDLANGLAEHPLVGPLHGEQRQSEGQQEVRNGQVEEEGVGQGEGARPSTLGNPVAPDHTQHQHIAHDSQDEHQYVNDRGVPLCKTVDVLLRARSSDSLPDFRGCGVVVIVTKVLLTGGRNQCLRD